MVIGFDETYPVWAAGSPELGEIINILAVMLPYVYLLISIDLS